MENTYMAIEVSPGNPVASPAKPAPAHVEAPSKPADTLKKQNDIWKQSFGERIQDTLEYGLEKTSDKFFELLEKIGKRSTKIGTPPWLKK